jgi:hypothetical protein
MPKGDISNFLRGNTMKAHKSVSWLPRACDGNSNPCSVIYDVIFAVLLPLHCPYPVFPRVFFFNFSRNSRCVLPGSGLPQGEKKLLKWVIDVTICYPNARPLDFFRILFADRPPCETVMYYRRYRAEDIPRDEEELTQWLFGRWKEKDDILASYYSSDGKMSESLAKRRILWVNSLQCVLINLAFITSTYIHFQMMKQVVGFLFNIFG